MSPRAGAGLKLVRQGDKPILTARRDVFWEKDAVFNTAVVVHEGMFHLFYRADTHPDPPWEKARASIGHAISVDGINFARFQDPVFRYGQDDYSWWGVEDPRVVRIGGTWHMTFNCHTAGYAQAGHATSEDLFTWTKHGVILPAEQFGPDKDTTLFPRKYDNRYCLMHRPGRTRQADQTVGFSRAGIDIAFSEDLHTWVDNVTILEPARSGWESFKIGGGAQPLETEKGWLIIYHGVDDGKVYRLGFFFLDKDDPTRVIYRHPDPILEPELAWELHGDVPNVVFCNGAAIVDETVWVYYGGADTVIGLATAKLDEFLSLCP